MKTITQSKNSPSCLNNQNGNLEWSDFIDTGCHSQVFNSLIQGQYYLCCYCESSIIEGNSHIEHLFPRNPKPPIRQNLSLCYQYSNLSISCNGGVDGNRHCGHYKENMYDQINFSSPYNSITFMLFKFTFNGLISPNSNLNAAEKKKAEYMISLLNLNCPRLVSKRKSHARSIINTLGDHEQQDLIQWFKDTYLSPKNGKLHSFYSLSKTILEP